MIQFRDEKKNGAAFLATTRPTYMKLRSYG